MLQLSYMVIHITMFIKGQLKSRLRLTHAQVVTPSGTWPKDLLVGMDGRIEALLARTQKGPEDCRIVSANGCFAYPGMIDLLTHGYGQHLYGDAEPGGVAENATALLKHGVTAFSPSITSKDEPRLVSTLERLSQNLKGNGARILGIHSEGPCLARPGAHRKDCLVTPSADLASKMVAAADGNLRTVTLAPELPGAREFMEVLLKNGVGIHLGHSNARPEDIPNYANLKISAVTHMYDVMCPANVLEEGVYPLSLADALIAEPRFALGIICDGVHVSPTQVKLLAQLPPERVFLETDSMKFTGLAEGRFELYPGTWVNTSHGKRHGQAARLDDGGLAGSCLTSDQAFRNFIRFTGADLQRASFATSLVPARLLGMEDHIGSLEVGKLADFVLLDPAALSVTATYLNGKERYRAETAFPVRQPKLISELGPFG